MQRYLILMYYFIFNSVKFELYYDLFVYFDLMILKPFFILNN